MQGHPVWFPWLLIIISSNKINQKVSKYLSNSPQLINMQLTKMITFNKNLSTVGSRLEFVRGGLSREEFAIKLGSSPASIQRYERAGGLPKAEILIGLVNIFKVNLNWLLTGVGEPYLYRKDAGEAAPPQEPPAPTPEQPLPRDDSAQLIQLVHQSQHALIQQIQANQALTAQVAQLSQRLTQLEKRQAETEARSREKAKNQEADPEPDNPAVA